MPPQEPMGRCQVPSEKWDTKWRQEGTGRKRSKVDKERYKGTKRKSCPKKMRGTGKIKTSKNFGVFLSV